MQALLGSTALVAVAEMGDKTQLLSFVLAARLRRPGVIIGGIAVATLANHALAASLGAWLAARLSPVASTWLTGLAFVAFGLWALRPDRLDRDPHLVPGGAFVGTLVAFFLVEMGDKTQLATVALAARYPGQLVEVVAGTTTGMLLANVPAVLIGEALGARLPLGPIRAVAAALFVAMGLYTLVAGPR